MKSRGRLRVKDDLLGRAFNPQLLDVSAATVRNHCSPLFRREIQFLRTHQRSHAATLVTVNNLLPPGVVLLPYS